MEIRIVLFCPSLIWGLGLWVWGCMVGIFWDAEVRCCIVVKCFHLELFLHFSKGCSSQRSTQKEILSTLNSTLATRNFFSPICIPKVNTKNYLLPMTLSTCKSLGKVVPWYYSNIDRAQDLLWEFGSEPVQVLVQITFLHWFYFLE